MQREQLLKQLENVSPALADNDLVPVLQDFWFTGNRVMAFNDRIAISTPCRTDFKGAVPGNLLLSLLKASAATNLEIETLKENLIIKALRARFKLPLRPTTSFIFEMPDASKLPELPFDKEGFSEALACLARSTSLDTSIPDQLGITITQKNGSFVEMFSTNDRTMSYAKLDLTGKIEIPRIILSVPFCEQARRLMKDADKVQLQIAKDYAQLRADDTILFGRLIESSSPVNFHNIVDQYFPKGTNGNPKIPAGLKRVIDRAVIAMSAGEERGRTEIIVKDGVAKLLSSGPVAEVKDELKIEGKQPDVLVKVNPDLIKVGYDDFDHMLITKRAVIMSKQNMVYLVSCGD